MQQQFLASRDKVFTGIFLTIAGGLLLLNKLVAGIVPAWLVSWPAAVIGFGLLIALVSKRKTILWIIPVFWGGFALLEQQMPELNIQRYSGAVSIIFVGFLFLGMRFIPSFYIKKEANKGDKLAINNVFSHNQNNFIVNNYTGSNLMCAFGNMEIKLEGDFAQDDAVIYTSVNMGVIQLTVPPNWVIKNNITTLLGAVSDERKPANIQAAKPKTITLAGNVTLGRLEIL